MYMALQEQIRNISWAFIILTHPSVLQQLDFIIYTRGGGSWYFTPRSRGGLANFTPIAEMGHLISEPKFKIPTTPLPLVISDKSPRACKCVHIGIKGAHAELSYPVLPRADLFNIDPINSATQTIIIKWTACTNWSRTTPVRHQEPSVYKNQFF